MHVPVHQRHDRHLRHPADLRVLPGLRQPRVVTLHIDNLQGRSTRTTSARPCSRPSPARCARRWSSTRARPASSPRPRVRSDLPDDQQPNHASPSSTTAWATCARCRRRCSTPPTRLGVEVFVTSDPEVVRAADARGAAGAGRHARLHARAARLRPAGRRCSRPPPASRCSASAWACRCCCRAARKGPTDGLGLIPGEVRQVRPGRPPAARRQPLQGAADGLEPGAARPRRAPDLGRRARPAATSISCTASTPGRPMRATARARPTTARALPRPLHAIIFSPPSSTPRRARTTGLQLYRNFLHWNP